MTNWINNVLPKLPFRPLTCVQRAGETLFVPSGWAHAVISLEASVGVAVEIGDVHAAGEWKSKAPRGRPTPPDMTDERMQMVYATKPIGLARTRSRTGSGNGTFTGASAGTRAEVEIGAELSQSASSAAGVATTLRSILHVTKGPLGIRITQLLPENEHEYCVSFEEFTRGSTGSTEKEARSVGELVKGMVLKSVNGEDVMGRGYIDVRAMLKARPMVLAFEMPPQH
jgi:hypothetical protein